MHTVRTECKHPFPPLSNGMYVKCERAAEVGRMFLATVSAPIYIHTYIRA